MWQKTLVPVAVAALAGATAAAAATPTLGPVTIIPAGHGAPVDIAGNHLHQGATIRQGTELRRWLVTMHGASQASVALACGAAGRTLGLGLQERSKVAFAVSRGSGYGSRTIRVHFYTAPGVSATGARGSAYLLCRTG
jgi:hypothetical protein